MSDHLFVADTAEPSTSLPTPSALVPTPLGPIENTMSCNGVSLRPITGLALPRGGRVSIWESPELRVELLETRYEPSLPDGMAIDDARILLWRIAVRAPVDVIRIEAGMRDTGSVELSGPASGEGLNALEFYSPGCTVHLGTEDEEWLAARASKAEHFPARWNNWDPELWWTPGAAPEHPWFEQSDSAIAVNLPALVPGDFCQVHFSIAWHSHPPEPVAHERSVDSWFAVDASPREVLAAVGVKP
jgi:hypothetical protein